MPERTEIRNAQHSRTHHWGERERNEKAHQDRRRRRDSELIQEPSRDARHERDRHENHNQAQCCGKYGMPDVGRSGTSSLKGVHSFLFEESKGIFEHNEGIVDNNSDHQDQSQHCHAIQCEMQCPHYTESCNQRRRNRHGRDHHRSPVAHKEKDNKTRQNAAYYQMCVDFMERRINEARLIFNDLQVHVGRKLRQNLRQALLYTVDDLHGVGAGLPPDLECNRWFSV